MGKGDLKELGVGCGGGFGGIWGAFRDVGVVRQNWG